MSAASKVLLSVRIAVFVVGPPLMPGQALNWHAGLWELLVRCDAKSQCRQLAGCTRTMHALRDDNFRVPYNRPVLSNNMMSVSTAISAYLLVYRPNPVGHVAKGFFLVKPVRSVYNN